MTIPFCTERNPRKCSAIRFSSIILAASLLIIFPNALTAFVTYPAANAVVNRDTITMHDPRPMPMLPQQQCRMSKNDYIDNNYGDPEADEEEDDDEDDPLEPVFAADVRGRPSGVVMEDLEWRLERLRLEEANTRRFLKSKPRFLPYQECQKWVQAWGERWTSAEEWYVRSFVPSAIV